MNTVYVQISDKCNLKCLHCVWDKTNSPLPLVLSRASLKPIWLELQAAGFEDINLTGGEPMINRDFFGILEDISALGFHKSVCTNGLFLNQKAIEEMSRIGVDYLSISLNSIDPEKNNDTRGQGRKVLEAARRCSLAGLPGLHINVTLHRASLAEITDLVQFAEEISAKISFQPLYVPRSSPDFKIYSIAGMTRDELEGLLGEHRDALLRSNNLSFLSLLESWYPSKFLAKPKECFATYARSKNMIIDHDGSVYPCFFRKDLVYGNVFRDAFSEIMNKHKLVKASLEKIPCFGEHCAGLHM